MGVPTSEVGYTPAMPRREDHEVHKDMWWHWTHTHTHTQNCLKVNPGGRAFWGLRLRPLACWDCGFESRQGVDVSLVSVVFCQVEVSASGWSLVQRSLECSAAVCDRNASIMRRPWPIGGYCIMGKKTDILKSWWFRKWTAYSNCTAILAHGCNSCGYRTYW